MLSNANYNLMETAAVISKGLHRHSPVRGGCPRLPGLQAVLEGRGRVAIPEERGRAVRAESARRERGRQPDSGQAAADAGGAEREDRRGAASVREDGREP